MGTGSQTVATAVAEMVFARLRLFAESPGTPWPVNASEHTAFAARLRTSQGLDLTAAPFDRQSAEWQHPTDYSACHALADAARAAGVQALRYRSARRPCRRTQSGAPGSRVLIFSR